jgi:hypothetical protein
VRADQNDDSVFDEACRNPRHNDTRDIDSAAPRAGEMGTHIGTGSR